MLTSVDPKQNFSRLEEKILKFWQKENIFKKSLEQRKEAPHFVFYEGPPTANAKPGVHHVLARVFKDLIPRYKTMRGFFVERKAGWDTHGLPVELEVEKELKFSGKKEIEKYGIEKFNQKCKENVWKYKEDWEELTRRIGFWIDLENPYITYENDYIESLWWIIKQIWDQKLLYQDYKVVPYCPRCGTALSSHELAQGYKSIKEDSVYLKLKVKGQKNTFFLIWTTTPWTLSANVALAVGKDINYVKV
ncbi:MAG TPA: isoleucine--tRNA ligase, partial [Candidatus Portnoybacteria bacterium]|nr:isoleucine--tRNA ligase [Candidatus Portnoybacteria bacterium]